MNKSRFWIVCTLLAVVTLAHWFVTVSNDDVASATTNFRTVVVTLHGEKMHEAGCPHTRDSEFELTFNQAVTEGYTPCKTCMPE